MAERLDDLMLRGRRIIQRDGEFCFSIDSVLLAHFPRLKPKLNVLDLGTGTGVIPLLIADDVAHVHAIELNPIMAQTARRSVSLNGLDDRITIIEGDYREPKKFFRAESFDLVTVNPPYRAIGSGEVNRSTGIANARHEFTATLDDVISAARFALKFGGTLCMIHIAERLCEIVDSLHRHQLEMKRLQLIQAKADRPPTLMLIEAKVGAHSSLKILPPLVVHNADGSYTEEIKKIYGL